MKNRDQGTGIRDQAEAVVRDFLREDCARPDLMHPEQGFMLLGLIVVIFIILLGLSVAAPVIARSLRRDRELEAVRRGNQYVRAIRLYYRKFGHYPGSIEQLEKTNTIRFLRRRYPDPITGKDDWHIIAVGANKTTVKGFFGEPLAGLPTTGLGSVQGMLSPGIGLGASAASGITGAAGAPGASGPAGASGATGSTGATDTSGGFGASAIGGPGGSNGAIGPAQASGGSNPLSGGTPFMGVGLNAPGDSILELNEQTSYQTWEFLYDPRIELLKQKAGLAGGGSIGPGQSATTFGAFGATGTTGTGTTAPAGTPGGTTPSGPAGPTTSPQP